MKTNDKTANSKQTKNMNVSYFFTKDIINQKKLELELELELEYVLQIKCGQIFLPNHCEAQN